MLMYNYGSNNLVFESKVGVKYNLNLRGRFTIVRGDSGSGKTYLVGDIKDLIDSPLENISNVFVVNSLDELKKVKDLNVLVIIDRGDLVIDFECRNYMKATKNIHYLVFARRNLGLAYSPNYIGTLEVKDGVICVSYKYSVKVWFE